MIEEALPSGEPPEVATETVRSPAANGLATVLVRHRIGATHSCEVAGFPGLEDKKAANAQ